MLYFLTDNTLIIYVQFIIGPKRKTSSLLEKLFENNSEYSNFLDSIFKRLKPD